MGNQYFFSPSLSFFSRLPQVIASVLRNLSWRADVNSKKTLREVGSVRALMECALEVHKVRPARTPHSSAEHRQNWLKFTSSYLDHTHITHMPKL